MKASLLFGFVSLALLPLCAADFAINTPYPGPVTSENDTKTLAAAATVGDTQTLVLSATLTFTLPSETPAYSEVTSEKLAIAADTDGTILVADAGANEASGGWIRTGCQVTADSPVAIKAVGKTVDGKLTFDVTVGTAEAVTVTSPAGGNALSTLSFTGEGSASDITLALVDTAIIPAPDGGTQDAGQVAKYVEWLNDTGSAMSDVTDTEALADAFAMNVGGTPKLEITAINVEEGTITVKGSCDGATAPLKTINGKLYITYAETLSGTPKSQVAEITVQTEEATTITLPEGARFVKAHVALTPPPAEL